jgi:hypothetical protein
MLAACEIPSLATYRKRERILGRCNMNVKEGAIETSNFGIFV